MHSWIKVKVKTKLVFFLLPKCQSVLVLTISKAVLGARPCVRSPLQSW